MRFVALLRGINVGGKNKMGMADLRTCFEAMGCTDVSTYIQSGNVLFSYSGRQGRSLERGIEEQIMSTFGYHITVVVLSKSQFSKIVRDAPPRFGDAPHTYRYDVWFIKEPLRPSDFVSRIPSRPEVDTVHAGTFAIYTIRCIQKATRSRLSRVTTLPEYSSITIRNWNTTQAIATLL